VSIGKSMVSFNFPLICTAIVAVVVFKNSDDKEILMAMNKTIHNVTHDYFEFHAL